jgi:hypothetical protein
MSDALAFDPVQYIRELKKAGFTQEQAEVQAQALFSFADQKLVTKKELQHNIFILQRDIAELRDVTDHKLATKEELQHNTLILQRDIAELKIHTDYNISELRKDLKAIETRLLIRLGSLIVVVAGLFATLKLF